MFCLCNSICTVVCRWSRTVTAHGCRLGQSPTSGTSCHSSVGPRGQLSLTTPTHSQDHCGLLHLLSSLYRCTMVQRETHEKEHKKPQEEQKDQTDSHLVLGQHSGASSVGCVQKYTAFRSKGGLQLLHQCEFYVGRRGKPELNLFQDSLN